jgi:hypothetical protein
MTTRLAAVAARGFIPREEGDPVPGDDLDQYLWWALLPGMSWRTRSAWPAPEIANAICAAACIVRLIEICGQSRLQKFLGESRRLRTWLDEAEGDDAAAFHRRVTLCLVMNIATSRSEPQHLVDYAKALLSS